MIRPLLKTLRILPLLLVGTILQTVLPADAQSAPPPLTKAPPTKNKKKNDPPGRLGRQSQVIDGAWRFRTDPQNSGEQESWPKTPPGDTKEILVPSLWTAQTAPGYTGTAWYWREFELDPKWKAQTVRLHFEAVAEKATIWLNGEKLGEHEGGATPFEFNVTKKLLYGARNTVTVRVEGDAKRGAGIWQGVVLISHDEAYLSEVSLTAGGLGQLSTAVLLENTSDNSGVAVLEGRVVAVSKPDKEVRKSLQNLSLTPGRNVTTLLTSVKGKNLHAWTLDAPTLYALQLAFYQGTDVLDTQQTVFGFREFGWKDNAITINGLPLPLKSLAPTFPLPVVVASTEDVDRARTSFQRLKEAGVTVLYLDAPHPELLHLADEVGMLVVESPRQGQSPQAAFEELQTLMLRDRSHPCLLAWRLRAAEPAQIAKLHADDPSRFLLIGTTGKTQLFLPGLGSSDPVSLPTGFLPAP